MMSTSCPTKTIKNLKLIKTNLMITIVIMMLNFKLRRKLTIMIIAILVWEMLMNKSLKQNKMFIKIINKIIRSKLLRL